MKEKYFITKTGDGKYEVEKEETNDAMESPPSDIEAKIMSEGKKLKLNLKPGDLKMIYEQMQKNKYSAKKAIEVVFAEELSTMDESKTEDAYSDLKRRMDIYKEQKVPQDRYLLVSGSFTSSHPDESGYKKIMKYVKKMGGIETFEYYDLKTGKVIAKGKVSEYDGSKTKDTKPIPVKIKGIIYDMVGFESKKDAKVYAEMIHNTMDADNEKQHQNRVEKTKLLKEHEKLASQLSSPKSDSKKLKKRMNEIASEVEKLDKEYKSMKTNDSVPKTKDEWKAIIQQFLQQAGIKGTVSYGSGGMSGEYYKVTVSEKDTDIDKLYNNVVQPFNRKYGDNKDYVYIVINKK